VANLIIDIGNTTTKAAFAEGLNLGKTHRYQGENVLDFIKELTLISLPDVIIISSVRTFGDGFFSDLTSVCKKLLILNDKTELPIVNGYATPSTLGPDRLSAAVAASYLFPKKNCIIFDFGTALTIDFINEKNEFAGGNISLGIRTRFKALNHYTQQLPLLDNPKEVTMIGGTTKEAIESGVVLGLIFEVEGYMNRFPDHTYIFTGGDAIYFAEKMKSSIFVVYNLVLMGLAHIADYHAKF
jgi:type III pantothenate kinase